MPTQLLESLPLARGTEQRNLKFARTSVCKNKPKSDNPLVGVTDIAAGLDRQFVRFAFLFLIIPLVLSESIHECMSDNS